MTKPLQKTVPTTIFDVCLKITSTFEGADYGTVSLNIDGNGPNFGILQLNFGTGTFQNYILNHINFMYYDFPKPITALIGSTPTIALGWLKDNCCGADGMMTEEWRLAWREFLLKPQIISLQKMAAGRYFMRAKEIAGFLGLSHQNARGMAFSYDTAVQVWSLGVNMPEPNHEQQQAIIQLYGIENYMLWNSIELTDEQTSLVIFSHLRALRCREEWRKAFFVRKATISIGVGIVNGDKHDFRKLFTES